MYRRVPVRNKHLITMKDDYAKSSGVAKEMLTAEGNTLQEEGEKGRCPSC